VASLGVGVAAGVLVGGLDGLADARVDVAAGSDEILDAMYVGAVQTAKCRVNRKCRVAQKHCIEWRVASGCINCAVKCELTLC
jgi:hypothetical protein